MRITSSIEYAARLMLTLAREHGKSPVSAESLSETDSIPSDYVSQILVKLRRAGIISSHRGSAGGYALSRPPAQITLGQVVRAVDRDVFEDVCGKYDAGAKDCRHQERCSISPVWRRLGGVINEYLESVTLASLLNLQQEKSCLSMNASRRSLKRSVPTSSPTAGTSPWSRSTRPRAS